MRLATLNGVTRGTALYNPCGLPTLGDKRTRPAYKQMLLTFLCASQLSTACHGVRRYITPAGSRTCGYERTRPANKAMLLPSQRAPNTPAGAQKPRTPTPARRSLPARNTSPDPLTSTRARASYPCPALTVLPSPNTRTAHKGPPTGRLPRTTRRCSGPSYPP